jgi:hypothetical protein
MVLPAFKRLRSKVHVKRCAYSVLNNRGTRGQRPVIRRGYQRLPGGAS